MAFFVRRAFKVGPVRINLSKSGFGLSAGVTGARVGISSRGKPYVAGGRHGLYYRKNLPLKDRGSRPNGGTASDVADNADTRIERAPEGRSTMSAAQLLGVVGGIFLICGFLVLLGRQPEIAGLMLLAVAIGFVVLRSRKVQGERLIKFYEEAVQTQLVHGSSPPTPMEMEQLKQQRAAILHRRTLRATLIDAETDAYHALMERVSEDREITEAEAALVKVAESLFEKSENEINAIKRDVFVETYMDFIEDQRMEAWELATLEGYVKRLRIPMTMVQAEIDTVNEILRAQRLAWPLSPLSRESLEVNLLPTETPYYTCEAKVLWRKRDRSRPTGYRFDVWRDGTLVMTERRFFVVGGGSTEVRFSEIGDIEVDMDLRLICISKTTSSRPVYLEIAEPIYGGAMLNVLNEAWRRGNHS